MNRFCIRLLFVLGFCAGVNLSVYGQAFSWVKTSGSSNLNHHIKPEFIRTDLSGNVVVVGHFTGEYDLDPGPNVQLFTSASLAVSDVYFQKFDSAGNLLWAGAFQGSDTVWVSGLYLDSLGSIYISGAFNSPTDFNPAPGVTLTNPLGPQDAYVCKFDSNGVFQWVSTFGDSSGLAKTTPMKIGALGSDILLAGSFGNTLDLDPGPGVFSVQAVGPADVVLIRMTQYGQFVWGKTMPSTDFTKVSGLVVDTFNAIWVVGEFDDSLDADPGPGIQLLTSVPPNHFVFIGKYSSNGDYLWSGIMGGSGIIEPKVICTGVKGNIYLACNLYGSVDVNPGPNTVNFHVGPKVNMALIYIKNDATDFFGKAFYNIDSIHVADMMIKDDNVDIVGFFKGTVDINPSSNVDLLTSNGNQDVFLLKLSETGLWFNKAIKLGSVNSDVGLAITKNHQGDLYMAGLYSDTVDFNFGLNVANYASQNQQGHDQFLLKLADCSIPVTNLNVTTCDSFTIAGYTIMYSGLYSIPFVAAMGCDSVVLLNLTILNPNYHQTIYHTECNANSYTINGQTYTASGTYVQQYTSQTGCDSNLTIHLILSSNTYTNLYVTTCDH